MEDLRDLRALLNRVTKRVDTDGRKLEAKVDKLMKLPDLIEIENLMKNMVWAIDLGDKDLWLSIWSDDINYTVPQSNIDIKGKKALKEFSESSHIHYREKKVQHVDEHHDRGYREYSHGQGLLYTLRIPHQPQDGRGPRGACYIRRYAPL